MRRVPVIINAPQNPCAVRYRQVRPVGRDLIQNTHRGDSEQA